MSEPQEDWSPEAAARELLRVARQGALATLDDGSGFPYASLVGVASAACGAPVLLLSGLARHTRNLQADPRCSILLAAASTGDPLAAARVTVFGRLEQDDAPGLRARYLARQAGAALYAGFGDFAVYRLRIERAHLVAGFGRIVELTAEQLTTSLEGAESLLEAEAGIAEHMNEDHRDALRLYATALLGAADGDWRCVGCDPDGIEIADGEAVRRLLFAHRARSATEVRVQLVDLVKQARAMAQSRS